MVYPVLAVSDRKCRCVSHGLENFICMLTSSIEEHQDRFLRFQCILGRLGPNIEGKAIFTLRSARRRGEIVDNLLRLGRKSGIIDRLRRRQRTIKSKISGHIRLLGPDLGGRCESQVSNRWLRKGNAQVFNHAGRVGRLVTGNGTVRRGHGEKLTGVTARCCR